MTIIYCEKCNATPLVDFGPTSCSGAPFAEKPACHACLGYEAYVGGTLGAQAALIDAQYPDRMCAWCLWTRSSPECNFGAGHRYQEHFA